jgi:sulfur-carrier protein
LSAKHEIHLWGALRPLAGGAPFVLVEAATIREMFRELMAAHPGLAPQIEQGLAVSINGQIYRDQWDVELPAQAEIFIMPRLAGG